MGEEHRGRGAGHRNHIVMLGIPDSVIAEAFSVLRSAHTVFEALRDIPAFNNAGKIKNRKGDCHRHKMAG